MSGNEIAIRNVLINAARKLSTYQATFSYEDPLCEIDDTATLWAQVGPCGWVVFDDKSLQSIRASMITDPCDGIISFGFEPCPFDNGSQSIAIRLSKGVRRSNVLNTSFTMPVLRY